MRPPLHRVALVSLFCAGCSSQELGVGFRATLPAEGPVPTLAIALLPFDPQQILDSLATAAVTPKPTFGTLEVELQAYEAPAQEALQAAAAPWRALRDSLATIADSLGRLSSGSTQYAGLFRRFRQMQRRLPPLAAQRDSLLAGLIGGHRALAERAQAAAESLRAWEEAAFASYEAVAEQALERSGREALTIQTDSSGTARLELQPGAWWAVARWPDPANPFLEYSWNVGFTVTPWLPTHVPLLEANARHRWRH